MHSPASSFSRRCDFIVFTPDFESASANIAPRADVEPDFEDHMPVIKMVDTSDAVNIRGAKLRVL